MLKWQLWMSMQLLSMQQHRRRWMTRLEKNTDTGSIIFKDNIPPHQKLWHYLHWVECIIGLGISFHIRKTRVLDLIVHCHQIQTWRSIMLPSSGAQIMQDKHCKVASVHKLNHSSSHTRKSISKHRKRVILMSKKWIQLPVPYSEIFVFRLLRKAMYLFGFFLLQCGT